MAGFNDVPLFEKVAVPAFCLLVVFLGYGSQLLFHLAKLDPRPPSRLETIFFNAMLLSLWFSYFKAVTVDPGRFIHSKSLEHTDMHWCKNCDTPKPARAHHCRTCQRCIPKMDHHCPWTRNCVSMTTFPHFLRFLFYANVSLLTLVRLLWQRCYAIWQSRHLPAYLGPSLTALMLLTLTSIVCFFTTFTLLIMLLYTVKNWMFNCTTIESWQIDRYEARILRGSGDWWDDKSSHPGDNLSPKIEFPYDIGIFSNMAEAMGTSNFLAWLIPFAGNPAVDKQGSGSGWTWRENGFNEREGMWPPLVISKERQFDQKPSRRRQTLQSESDLAKDGKRAAATARYGPVGERTKLITGQGESSNNGRCSLRVPEGSLIKQMGAQDEASLWESDHGEQIRDFGVDEDADTGQPMSFPGNCEAFADEDVPLGLLLRRRQFEEKYDLNDLHR